MLLCVCNHAQAIDLMQQWVPIDVADALELLSPDFKNEEVRRHAVSVLQRHDDDELLYYLLQLVQVGVTCRVRQEGLRLGSLPMQSSHVDPLLCTLA